MTTFTQINATETQSNKALTESLMTRLANNVLAIQEGDPTAPKIQQDAIQDGAISVIDTVQGSGSLSLSFDHGQSTAQDVYITFSAGITTSNASTSDYSLEVNGVERVGSTTPYPQGNYCISGGYTISLGSGSHSIALTVPGGVHSFLSVMVFKK